MQPDHLLWLPLLQCLPFHQGVETDDQVCLVGGRGCTKLIASPTPHLQTYFVRGWGLRVSIVRFSILILKLMSSLNRKSLPRQ